MPTPQEKTEFSLRLKSALRKVSPPVKGATELARLFNLQHITDSDIGISVQTAHKWLNGRAIPTPEKIKTLAAWLSVNEHWLHYGPAPDSKQPSTINQSPLLQAERLLEQIKALPGHQQYLVEELIACLSKNHSN